MDENRPTPGWPMIAGIAGAAALVGFGASHFLAPGTAPAPVAPAAAPAAPTPSEVEIPAAYLASAGITVERVATGGVGGEIIAPATVAALPSGEATVVARAAGTITRINRRLGDAVRAGEVLALVDSLDAATMSADRSVAGAKVNLAQRSYQREASLFRQGVTPRQDFEAAQSALAVAQAEARRASSVAQAAHVAGNGRSVAVTAPMSGRITAEDATLGAYVQPQAELFRLAASGAVQVEASVTADDARRIGAGDTATIQLDTGSPVAATVRSVTPTANGATQSVTVVLVPQSGGALVVGQGVQVRLHSRGGSSGGMTVPEEAVQNLDGRDVVFVRTGKGFRAQPVLVGTRSGGVAQIISGVRPGEQVATRNAFRVKAEMNKNAGGDEE